MRRLPGGSFPFHCGHAHDEPNPSPPYSPHCRNFPDAGRDGCRAAAAHRRGLFQSPRPRRLRRRQHHARLRRGEREVLSDSAPELARRVVGGRKFRRQRPHAPEKRRFSLLEGSCLSESPRLQARRRRHHARHQRHQAAELETRGGIRRRLHRAREILPRPRKQAARLSLPPMPGARARQLRHP